jgi:DNA-binding response OmpR family regulator
VALLARLLDQPGQVVHRTDLHRAGWPTGGRDQRAVDGRIRSLRRRLVGMGVAIHTVRGVGYLLEVDRG